MKASSHGKKLDIWQVRVCRKHHSWAPTKAKQDGYDVIITEHAILSWPHADGIYNTLFLHFTNTWAFWTFEKTKLHWEQNSVSVHNVVTGHWLDTELQQQTGLWVWRQHTACKIHKWTTLSNVQDAVKQKRMIFFLFQSSFLSSFSSSNLGSISE